jgi:hypothetical protein
VYKISHSWVDVLNFPFIWSRVSGLMRFRHGSDIGMASNFVQLSETLAVIRRAFGEEGMSRTQKFQIHTTVTFYGDCVKMREDFASNSGDKRTGCCNTAMHHLTLPFSPGKFLTKNHDCHPTPTLLLVQIFSSAPCSQTQTQTV